MKISNPIKSLVLFAAVALGCTLAKSATPPNTPPQFDADISAQTIPAGKVLVVPVTASDANGDPIQYSVSSSNPHIMARVRTGNPSLVLNINYAGDPNSQSPGAAAFSGTMTFQLFSDLTPVTAFIIGGLAQGGFYNGLIFHRITSLSGTNVPSTFIVQGGDPNGDGSGGPGFSFDNEFHSALVYSGRGQLAMANAGYDSNNSYAATNGSQFFITNGPQRPLDFNNPIFGQLLRGFDVLDRMVGVVTDSNGKPTVPVTIESAQVVPNTGDAVLYLSANASGSATITVKIWDGKTFAANGKTPLYVTKAFSAAVADDTTNDPPFLVPPSDAVTPLNKPVSIHLKGVDLESDYLIYSNEALTDSIIMPLFAPADFQSPRSLALQLSDTTNTVSTFLMSQIPPADQLIITNTASTSGTLVTVLQPDLNAIISSGSSIYDPIRFAAVSFSQPTLDLQAENPTGDALVRLNRLMLMDAYPGEFSVPNNVIISGKNPAKVTPSNGFDRGFGLLVAVRQLTGGFRGSTLDAYDYGSITIGVGDKALSPLPVAITAQPGVAFNHLVANFTDADLQATPASFNATVNWGDGSALSSTGSNATITSGTVHAKLHTFQVSSSHTYNTAGTFPLTVVVSDTNGATTTVSSRAVVSSGPVTTSGKSLTTSGAISGVLATFTDTGVHSVKEYQASINWGDGAVTAGTVATSATANVFNVTGKHTYADGDPFTACVTITGSNGHQATAWSSVRVGSGKSSHLPPFPVANLTAAWTSGPTIDVSGTNPKSGYLRGSLIIVNSGVNTSQIGNLQFYISSDQNAAIEPGTDTLLFATPAKTQTALPIFPVVSGGGINYDFHPALPALPGSTVPQPDTRIPVTFGPLVTGTGQFIKVQLNYHDPLLDHMAVGKIFTSNSIQLTLP